MDILICGAAISPVEVPGPFYPFTVFQPDGRVIIGLPPILKEKNVNCQDCGEVHDYETCPICGSWIFPGYGLMGGGMGSYWLCDSDNCPWFYKVLSLMENE